jgi:hypothetical protein
MHEVVRCQLNYFVFLLASCCVSQYLPYVSPTLEMTVVYSSRKVSTCLPDYMELHL